jgi:pimeloyl-ACP methyl ester carboxylesterase
MAAATSDSPILRGDEISWFRPSHSQMIGVRKVPKVAAQITAHSSTEQAAFAVGTDKSPRCSQTFRRFKTDNPTGVSTLVVILLCSVAIAGCSPPVGVTRVDNRTSYQLRNRNVLSTGAVSEATRNVLTRWDLSDRFDADPVGALAALQSQIANGNAGSDEIYALAELSFQHAERTRQRTWYLAASVYAFAYLFPDGANAPPDPYDPRLRTATDLYCRGLTQAFASTDGSQFEPKGGEFALPFGKLRIDYDPANAIWANRRLVDFVPVSDFRVFGVRNHYRQAGIGAALAASSIPLTPERGFQIAPRMKTPVTIVLRIANPRTRLAAGILDVTLELYPPSHTETVHLGGQNVPLEVERTTALAYGLGDKALWAQELRGFLAGDLLNKAPTRLVALGPYRPGLFPVVFIHGTASSAGRWADMVNELLSDSRIREHFQFWFFSYDTGNPIPYSALLLREELRDAVAKIDPGGNDAALRHMALIGHSQGGLLAKLLAVDTGTRFWDAFSHKPLDELDLPTGTRELARRTMFFDHSPLVSRVVFIATPQRGSYLAGTSLPQLIARLVKLPLSVLEATGDLLANNSDVLKFDPTRKGFGTSVNAMTPGSSFINAIAPLPIAPRVAAHSIIAVKGDGPVESGDDGVVAYSSAHLPGVVSELVVRSGHSTQSDPRTINEVRRILLLHLGESCARRVHDIPLHYTGELHLMSAAHPGC